MRISHCLVMVGLLGCSGSVSEPVFLPSAERLEVSFSADDIAAFERVDGFVVSPLLEATVPFERVLVDAQHEGGTVPFEVLAGGAPAPLQVESEEGLLAGRVDVRATSRIRLRWPVSSGRVWVLRVTGLEQADVEPLTTDEVMTSRQALGSSFAALGVQPRSAWGAGGSAASSDGTRKYRAAVHHTVTRPDNGPAAIRHILSLHRARGFNDVGYHFLITRDGTIWEGRPVDRIGAHAGNQNPGNVGIVLVGCFEPGRDCDSVDRSGLRTPTDAMLNSLARLLAVSGSTFGFPMDRSRVKGHQEWMPNHTACPGRTTMQRLDGVVAQARGGGGGGAPAPSAPACQTRAGPFAFSCAGALPGMACTAFNEPADRAGTWNDNFLCSTSELGLRFSSSGDLPGMRCISLHEGAEPASTTWTDNRLCVPQASPFRFEFSAAGPIPGRQCLRLFEPADPNTWNDNYLCWNDADQGIQRTPRFAFSSKGPLADMAECVNVIEAADETMTWGDNYFCASTALGLKWSSAGPIPGMACALVNEGADGTTWADNYLCVPPEAPVRFSFHSAYSPAFVSDACVAWYESADARSWHDNFLCPHTPNRYETLAGDFDGDGLTDTVTVSPNGGGGWANWFAMELGTGISATWASGTPQHLRNGGEDSDYRILVADFTGDGRSDVLVFSPEAGGGWADWVTVDVSTGTGFVSQTWQAQTPLHARNGGRAADYRIFAADVDGDDKADLITLSPNAGGGWANWVAIELSTGTGFESRMWAAAAPQHLRNGGSGEVTVAVGDFDGDGRADLVVGSASAGGGWADWFAMERSTGTGFVSSTWASLTPRHLRNGGAGAFQTLVGDFNGDGRDDLATVSSERGGGWREWVAMDLSTGSGFRSEGWLAATPLHMRRGGVVPYRTVVADVTGDGRDDLVTLSPGAGGGWAEWFAIEVSTGTGFSSQSWAAATPAHQRNGGASQDYRVLVGRLDADTKADLLISSQTGGGGWADWFAWERSTGTGFASSSRPAATPQHVRNGGR
jgi:hypothetical protein